MAAALCVLTHLRPGDDQGPVENHPGEEARVPEDGSEGDHAAHAVADQEQGKVRMLVLYVYWHYPSWGDHVLYIACIFMQWVITSST